jgi:hypothetical protein
MQVLIQMVNTVGIEQRASALNAMDLISFLQQELGKVSPILPCDACD